VETVLFEAYLLPLLIAPIALAWGGERFVDGASALSLNLGVQPLMIGVLVMGFGTSLPEFLVSVFASTVGNPGLALGNAYGSNIINIGIVLGLAAILSPVTVRNNVVKRELPLLLLATALTAYLVSDGQLLRGEAVVLVVLFLVLLTYLSWDSLQQRAPGQGAEKGQIAFENPPALSLGRSITYLAIGLLIIALSSAALVWGARGIIADLGVSEAVVAVVVLALGTSLPELVVIIVAARRGSHALAFGNVIGSNLFNTLAVVGTAAFIAPATLSSELVSRDLPVMFAFTAVLLVMAYGWGRRTGVINKVEGAVLLLAAGCYLAYLVYQTPILA
jgi:cation:H+ antiporter